MAAIMTLTAAARLATVRTVTGQAFDVTETAKRALGLHWQQRTSAERGEFVQLFRDLLERGYRSRIGEYGGEQIKYMSEEIDGDHAIVRALIVTKKGTQIPVESRLLQKADRWLIYDVLVENASLIANIGPSSTESSGRPRTRNWFDGARTLAPPEQSRRSGPSDRA